MKFYEKALLTSPYVIAGKPVQFEPLAGNHGVLALDEEKDAELIKALEIAADKKVGGIGRITEEQFEQKKKLHPWKPSAPKSWLDEPLKIAGRKAKPPQRPEKALPATVAPVKEANGQASEVPQRPPDQPDFRMGDFKPATKRLGKAAETPNPI